MLRLASVPMTAIANSVPRRFRYKKRGRETQAETDNQRAILHHGEYRVIALTVWAE